jgi:CRISPR-associated protein Cas6
MVSVDVQFSIQETLVPADHGYQLFSAISKVVPSLHGDDNVGIHSISGPPMGNRVQSITDKSFLTFRLPSELIGEILPLSGKVLNVAGSLVRVGVPYSRSLVPSPRLYCRLVVIKGFMEPKPFMEAVQRQLDSPPKSLKYLNSNGSLLSTSEPCVSVVPRSVRGP